MLKCHLGAGTILLVFREFIKLSCDVLQEFFESNPEDTERLLTRNRPRWRNLSCLEIAFRLKHRPFMSHEACKIPINKIWFGHISPENNSFRVWTVEKRVIFIFYLCRAFFFFQRRHHCNCVVSDDNLRVFSWFIPICAEIYRGTTWHFMWSR